MRQITVKSAVPIYAAAAVWLLCAFVFPFYKLLHFLIAAAVSVALYFILAKVCPTKTIQVQEPERPVETGSPAADAIIREGRQTLKTLAQLNDAIPDPKVSAAIERIQTVSGKIFDYIAEHPGKSDDIRRFLNYYLPTTIKLLKSYSKMDDQGINSGNIGSAMKNVEGMLQKIGDAFEKQLDHLFADEALDISTDITVLEGMMAQEGLTGEGFPKKPE